MLTVDVLPFWKDRPVRELTRRDVRAILERITKRKAPIAANRTLEVVRKMLNFGVSHDWLEANPGLPHREARRRAGARAGAHR